MNAKISDLTEHQKGHMAFRIDKYTGVGMLTACATARGDLGDLDLVEAFKRCGCKENTARRHARRCKRFALTQARINSLGGAISALSRFSSKSLE